MLAWVLSIWLPAPARGDEILVDGRSLHRVAITAYHDGDIEYRTPGGDYARVPLRTVRFIALDSVTGVADFNQAEEYLLKDQPLQAVDRYERALRAARGFWEQIVDVRLLMAAERAGQFEKAVRSLLRTVAHEPATAAYLIPHLAATTESRARQRTLTRIEQALQDAPSDDARVVLQLLQYDALRAINDPAASAGAETIARMRIPPHLLTPRTLEIKQAALDTIVAAKRYAEAVSATNDLLTDAPQAFLPDVLLIKARALLAAAQTNEDYLQAALPAMRIVIHFPDAPQAAEGLLLAARAHAGSGRRAEAVRLLRNCIGRDTLSPALRQEAQEQLDALTPGNPPSAS